MKHFLPETETYIDDKKEKKGQDLDLEKTVIEGSEKGEIKNGTKKNLSSKN